MSNQEYIEVESVRRKTIKRQKLIQWFWIAGSVAILLAVVSMLGKVTTGSYINPLKAKQLAYMIAKPPEAKAPEEQKGEAIQESAGIYKLIKHILVSTAFAKSDKGKGSEAGSGEPLKSQTVVGDVLEIIMMAFLWILFGMSFSGIYILWTVRQANFFVDEDDLQRAENELLRTFKATQSPKDRARAWNLLSKRDPLKEIYGDVNHLSEVLKQIGEAALSSETALDRYFINQSKDIKEEESQKLHLVNTALNVAPAVGFAGTVQGMIVAFSLLGENASPEMINAMSQGIFIALVTTFMALLIKSVGLTLKSFISQKIIFYSTQLQLISSEVSSRLHDISANEESGEA